MDERAIGSERFTALVIADTAGAAETSVEAAGGRTRRRIAWTAVADDLGPQPDRPILLIETQGIDDALLADALPRLASAIRLLELHAIVALGEEQIDRVAGALLGERVQLLCEPSDADRVAALALAAEIGTGQALHDQVSEGEAARLARLNEEVARIAEVLARLTRGDAPPAGAIDGVGDRRGGFDAGPVVPDQPIGPASIRGAIRARRLRDRQFGTGLFEDPAWDMMLDLFAAHLERTQVSVSSLCIAAAVAPTTALRWIGKLTDAGLFERQPDPFDRRRAFMALSARGLAGMNAYFATLRSQGLPPA